MYVGDLQQTTPSNRAACYLARSARLDITALLLLLLSWQPVSAQVIEPEFAYKMGYVSVGKTGSIDEVVQYWVSGWNIAKAKCIDKVNSAPAGTTAACTYGEYVGKADVPGTRYINGFPYQVDIKYRNHHLANFREEYITDEPPITQTLTWSCSVGATPRLYSDMQEPTYTFYCGACPQPYIFDETDKACKAYCAKGDSWDSVVQACVPQPEEQSCKTQTDKPIDLHRGRKFRSEHVISAGSRYPFSLRYHFNNQGSREKTQLGYLTGLGAPEQYLASEIVPLRYVDYEANYTSSGTPKSNSAYKADQFYGSVAQYWRHNYDHVLIIHQGKYRLLHAEGQEISFEGLGFSNAYPHLDLKALQAGEEGFDGYSLQDHKSGQAKVFDASGRLRKIKSGSDSVLTFSYDSSNRLQSILNSEGAGIHLEYQSLQIDSIYSTVASSHPYPVRASNSLGESVTLDWQKKVQGESATFHMLTFISEASSGESKAGRSFAYNDSRWPASVTDIYTVSDATAGTMQLYAHFEYDDQGRAIYSGLANGFEAERVEYLDDYSRIVTNALGKKATYTFADLAGARRLQSVTGEPTQNCVQSEVQYQYDPAGNVAQKTENGIVTQYQYDNLNREISRTEAAGTPEARVIQTEYHPSLNLPITITEPGQVTEMQYDADGRLLSRSVRAVAQ